MLVRKMVFAVAGVLCISYLHVHACSTIPNIAEGLMNDVEVLQIIEQVEASPASATHQQKTRGLNKYEIMASNLGVIKNDSWLGSIEDKVGKLLKALAFPGMVAANFGTFIISKDEDMGFDASVPNRLALCALAAAITFVVLDGLGNYLSDSTSKKYSKFNDFVQNWPSHKIETPDEYHPLFDGLYMQYTSNNHINVSDIFIDELLKNVAMTYIQSLITVAKK